MPCPEKQLWTAIPNRHDHSISLPQTLQWVLVDSRKTQVSNLDDTLARHEDVGGFKIAMQDPIGVEKGDAAQELVEQGFERGRWDRYADRRRVVVDDLLWALCR